MGNDDHAAKLVYGRPVWAKPVGGLVGKTSLLLSVGVSFSGPQLAAPRANLQMPKRRRTFTTRTGTNKAVALESAATEAATKSAAEGQHFH